MRIKLYKKYSALNRSPLSKLPLKFFVFEIQVPYESVVNNKSFQLKKHVQYFMAT